MPEGQSERKKETHEIDWENNAMNCNILNVQKYLKEWRMKEGYIRRIPAGYSW